MLINLRHSIASLKEIMQIRQIFVHIKWKNNKNEKNGKNTICKVWLGKGKNPHMWNGDPKKWYSE